MKHTEIKELISIFDESDLTRLEINDKEFSIMLEKGTVETVVAAPVQKVPAAESVAVSAATVPAEANETTPASDVLTIDSPMVGTFYVAPSPGSPAFVKAGDKVSKGQTIGIVEAMKIMNEIEAEFDCVIKAKLVEDGQPVEYGTALFEVEKL